MAALDCPHARRAQLAPEELKQARRTLQPHAKVVHLVPFRHPVVPQNARLVRQDKWQGKQHRRRVPHVGQGCLLRAPRPALHVLRGACFQAAGIHALPPALPAPFPPPTTGCATCVRPAPSSPTATQHLVSSAPRAHIRPTEECSSALLVHLEAFRTRKAQAAVCRAQLVKQRRGVGLLPSRSATVPTASTMLSTLLLAPPAIQLSRIAVMGSCHFHRPDTWERLSRQELLS